jgi:hypothetical protein
VVPATDRISSPTRGVHRLGFVVLGESGLGANDDFG